MRERLHGLCKVCCKRASERFLRHCRLLVPDLRKMRHQRPCLCSKLWFDLQLQYRLRRRQERRQLQQFWLCSKILLHLYLRQNLRKRAWQQERPVSRRASQRVFGCRLQ